MTQPTTTPPATGAEDADADVVEAMARAINAADCQNYAWEHYGPYRHDVYRAQARAALAAQRRLQQPPTTPAKADLGTRVAERMVTYDAPITCACGIPIFPEAS